MLGLMDLYQLLYHNWEAEVNEGCMNLYAIVLWKSAHGRSNLQVDKEGGGLSSLFTFNHKRATMWVYSNLVNAFESVSKVGQAILNVEQSHLPLQSLHKQY